MGRASRACSDSALAPLNAKATTPSCGCVCDAGAGVPSGQRKAPSNTHSLRLAQPDTFGAGLKSRHSGSK
jgi:hypothetical protein